jgi:hypothetical protein
MAITLRTYIQELQGLNAGRLNGFPPLRFFTAFLPLARAMPADYLNIGHY